MTGVRPNKRLKLAGVWGPSPARRYPQIHVCGWSARISSGLRVGATDRRRLRGQLQGFSRTPGTHADGSATEAIARRAPANKRLKLAGVDRFKGSGVLCASAHELSSNDTAPCGRVARSLSAIR